MRSTENDTTPNSANQALNHITQDKVSGDPYPTDTATLRRVMAFAPKNERKKEPPVPKYSKPDKAYDLLLLRELSDHADSLGRCWPGKGKIHRRSLIPRRSVDAAIERNVARGALVVKERMISIDPPVHGTNFYVIVVGLETEQELYHALTTPTNSGVVEFTDEEAQEEIRQILKRRKNCDPTYNFVPTPPYENVPTPPYENVPRTKLVTKLVKQNQENHRSNRLQATPADRGPNFSSSFSNLDTEIELTADRLLKLWNFPSNPVSPREMYQDEARQFARNIHLHWWKKCRSDDVKDVLIEATQQFRLELTAKDDVSHTLERSDQLMKYFGQTLKRFVKEKVST